jgi:hypothetical protein
MCQKGLLTTTEDLKKTAKEEKGETDVKRRNLERG